GRTAAGVSEVLNDRHGDLMNVYAVLKSPEAFGRLRARLEMTLFAEAEWESARVLLDTGGGGTVERAAALFAFCRMCLSGRMGRRAGRRQGRAEGRRQADRRHLGGDQVLRQGAGRRRRFSGRRRLPGGVY